VTLQPDVADRATPSEGGATVSLGTAGSAESGVSPGPDFDPAEIEQRARAALPAYVTRYFETGAGSSQSLAESVAAWSTLRFWPRILTGVDQVSTATTVLGTPVASPILVAPMAQQVAAHPDGEAAMARGAYAAGSLLGVSTHTGVPFDAITGTGSPWWYQVYVMRDRTLTARLVERAVAAGAGALILTADMNALLPPAVNPRHWPTGPGRNRYANLTAAELEQAGVRGAEVDPTVGLAEIGWLARISGLPVLVKGVLRADDARLVVDAGAVGVVVSTHGGRRMGSSVSSAAALPGVVAAVGTAAEVYVDSGIRTAEHVAAALALGARGVFVGRPAMWALAADGDAGVQAMLTALTTELALVMLQLGVGDVAALTADLLA
jgi:4-hydroxymandelate oxidase